MISTEDICRPISTAELERRWSAVRKTMDVCGLDVLVMQANNDFHGGYVKWFTDAPAVNGGYQTVLFPRDEPMTVVRHGPAGERTVRSDDPLNRGVGKVLTEPTFAAVEYKKYLAADRVVEELAPRLPCTIGLVGTGSMSHAFAERLNSRLLDAELVDGTELVDEIKAIKSEEEIARIRETASMQDAVWEQVVAEVTPGMRGYELSALAQHAGQRLGSEQGIFLSGSRPLGEPGLYGIRHLQNRRLREGDQFTLLIENNGGGGYYCEMGRTCVLGKASRELLDEFQFAVEAQRHTLSLIEPGARPADVLVAYNRFLRENRRPEETRLHAHGQGYDMVERPLFCAEETMPLAAGMNLTIHPTWVTEAVHSWVADNFLVTEDGVSTRLHRTPQRIFEI